MSTPKQRRGTFQKEGRDRAGSKGSSSLKRLTAFMGKKDKLKEQRPSDPDKPGDLPQLYVQGECSIFSTLG